jgi:hypothetical protein
VTVFTPVRPEKDEGFLALLAAGLHAFFKRIPPQRRSLGSGRNGRHARHRNGYTQNQCNFYQIPIHRLSVLRSAPVLFGPYLPSGRLNYRTHYSMPTTIHKPQFGPASPLHGKRIK